MTHNNWKLVFDAGGTSIRFGLVDEKGNIDPKSLRSTKTAKSIATREDFRELIVSTIKALDSTQEKFVISVAGPISSDYRVIRKYTNVMKDDTDIPVAEMVEERIKRDLGRKIEVCVIKDAVAASLAEMGPSGAAFDRDEVIALILGTGTGGAPCRREQNGLFSFPETLSDLGHHQVDIFNTEACNCGAMGCVELQTSGTGVIRNINRLARYTGNYFSSMLHSGRGIQPGFINGEDIAWAASNDDLFTLDILHQAARPLAALLRNIFTSHPEMTVVFTGGFSMGVGEPLLKLVRDCLKDSKIPFINMSCLDNFIEERVVLGKIPSEQTNLVGARMFLMQKERLD